MKCRGARIAICENFSPFNFFFSSYIYILGCRRCLVAPDTIVHRPWTCLFGCLVIDCDIGLNVVCGVKKIESINWLGLDVRRYKA